MLFCVIFVDFLNVACLNEFFVYLIYLIIDIPPIRVVILDFIYAVIFPMSILCLGKKLHELNLWNEMSLCPRSLCRDEGEDDKVKITNMNASFGNNIIVPCYTLCNKRKMCPFEYNCISFFSSFLPVCFFFTGMPIMLVLVPVKIWRSAEKFSIFVIVCVLLTANHFIFYFFA